MIVFSKYVLLDVGWNGDKMELKKCIWDINCLIKYPHVVFHTWYPNWQIINNNINNQSFKYRFTPKSPQIEDETETRKRIRLRYWYTWSGGKGLIYICIIFTSIR